MAYRRAFFCNDGPTPEEERRIRLREIMEECEQICDLSDEACEEFDRLYADFKANNISK